MKYIYKIINPNNEVYIGKTNDINKRLQVYEGIARRKTDKSNSKIHQSFIQYGFENHKCFIIFKMNCDNNMIHDIERYFMLRHILDGFQLLNVQIKFNKLSKIFKFHKKNINESLTIGDFENYYTEIKEQNRMVAEQRRIDFLRQWG